MSYQGGEANSYQGGQASSYQGKRISMIYQRMLTVCLFRR
jgi:hypothetical protein